MHASTSVLPHVADSEVMHDDAKREVQHAGNAEDEARALQDVDVGDTGVLLDTDGTDDDETGDAGELLEPDGYGIALQDEDEMTGTDEDETGDTGELLLGNIPSELLDGIGPQ